MNKKRLWVMITVVLLIGIGCSSADKSANKSAIVDGIVLPEGWSKVSYSNLIVAPEKDMKMYFFKEKMSKKLDFSKRSVELWRGINPDFQYKEKVKTSPPSKDGWDYLEQIVYDTPVEKGILILSLLRVKDGIGHINLIISSNGTLSKRSPQMATLIDSWKPDTIKKEDFSKKNAKKFSNIEKDFNDFVTKQKKILGIPGLVIGIIQDGKVVYKKGFGRTKIKGGKKVNPDTLFMIGSTSKSLSTLMMSKLKTDKKIDWNDRIDSYLSEWKLKDKNSTKSMLMKHTACACTGMPRRDLDFILEIDGISAEQRMAQMADMNPTTKPGETFQYSNYLVAAGGYAASKAYRPKMSLSRGYDKAMRDLVFSPLKMNRTMTINKMPYRKNSAFPHAHNLSLKTELIPTKLDEMPNSLAPAGSIWSNIDDMLKYVAYELSNGESLENYISKEDLLLRRKKGVKITDDFHYGLGLFIENKKGIEIFHHGGNTMGFTSDMFFIPSKNIGVVTLTNLGQANVFRSSVKSKLLELFFGMDNKADESIAFYQKEIRKRSLKTIARIKPSIKNRRAFLGNYQSKELGSLKITEKGKKLFADFGEFKTEMREVKNNGKNKVFVLIGSPWSGSFELIYDNDNFRVDGAQKKYLFKKL